jgi:F-type H+-transporting ATPase subunit delta
MQDNEISTRYAKALFSLAKENNNSEKVFAEIREIKIAILADEDLEQYLSSSMASRDELFEIINKTFQGKNLSEEVVSFLQLLVKKDRLAIFSGVVSAYEKTIDEANGVTRGVVRSTSELSTSDRLAIKEKVSKALNKKVIFTYSIDETIMGGLVVEVGGYRFDDTIIGHLKRLKDELKRSSH